MDEVDSVSKTIAASILRRTTKRCGDTPVARLKRRAKWYGLMFATEASSASGSSRCKLLSM